jgi:hypothetical protein
MFLPLLLTAPVGTPPFPLEQTSNDSLPMD